MRSKISHHGGARERSADSAFPKIDQRQIGAVASKLIAASISEIAVIFARSPAHRHHALGDIEWMVPPAAMRVQPYIGEFANAKTGVRAPTPNRAWAFASEEVDRRICSNLAQRIYQRPERSNKGGTGWIVALIVHSRRNSDVYPSSSLSPGWDSRVALAVRECL